MRSSRGANLLGLAATCRTFGQLPSERLGILDSAVAFDLDQTCATLLVLTEAAAIRTVAADNGNNQARDDGDVIYQTVPLEQQYRGKAEEYLPGDGKLTAESR